MTALEKLNKIPVYGKPVTYGNLYFIKWRLNRDKAGVLYKRLIARHPGLKADILWHKCQNGMVLLGGKFDTKSGIKETASLTLMSIPKGS